MLTHRGEARSAGADRRLAWSLACIAGALNTAGFYAVGVFTSNMTGNVAAVADHLALADLAMAGKYLALVVVFVTGAAVCAVLINAGQRRRAGGIYAFGILVEAVLLTGLAGADLWFTGPARDAVLAYGLSFLMGLQNAVVTRVSAARVRTTHVTGMLTDFGIELGNLVDFARLDSARKTAGHDYNGARLRLHGVTVLAFLGGGVAGVLAYRSWGAYLLLAAAILLFLLAARGLRVRPAEP